MFKYSITSSSHASSQKDTFFPYVERNSLLFSSIPFIELLISIVIELVHSAPEMSVSFTPISIGLLLIVLSIYFQDGVNLQNDVDGLI